MKRKYQIPPTREQIESINSDAINALAKRIADAVNHTDAVEPQEIAWTLLHSAQSYIAVHENEDYRKAAKILHSMTSVTPVVRCKTSLQGKRSARPGNDDE